MKIAVLHRYPPKQVTGTNASFTELLIKIVKDKNKVFYLTFKEKVISEKIAGVNYIELPFYFNRGSNIDKIAKTILWIILSPFYVVYLNNKFKVKTFYCDDSVPFYGFLAKLFSPSSRIFIRLGDLQTGYLLADKHPMLFQMVSKVESFMWKKMDKLIAISDAFKDYIVSKGVDKKKVFVVEESINIASKTFANKTSGKDTTFMFHGSMATCKGLDTLIDAFKIVRSKNSKYKLIIAGGGEESSRIIARVANEQIKGVTFTGWYDHQKLDDIMQKTDISIVMRSGNFANNFIVTTCLLENWCYSKPVIVPNLMSFKQNVKESVSGIFFEPDNPTNLAEKMLYLASKPNVWSTLGKNGQIKADQKFNHKKIAIKLSKIISNGK